MFRIFKAVAAYLLTAWILASICALIDLVYYAIIGSYFTESVPGVISYFSQNTIANFVFLVLITIILSFIASIFLRVFKKPKREVKAIIIRVFPITTLLLLLFVTALIANEVYLPYIFAPISILVNSLILLAGVVLALLASYLNKHAAHFYRHKVTIIGTIILSVISLAIILVNSIGSGQGDYPSNDENINGPNIIIITIDALRRDRISAYGEHPGISPNIDAFGERAVRFNNACAPAPWTIPSMYSMLCSRYHGVHGAEMFEMGHPDIPMMPVLLKDKGYRTEACIANAALYGEFGFNRGFDRYIEYGGFSLFESLNKSSLIRAIRKINSHVFPYIGLSPEDSTTWLTNRVIRILEKKHSRPLFLWAHYLDPHTPLAPPREYIKLSDEEADAALAYARLRSEDFLTLDDARKEELSALYEAEVSYVDDCIGDIVDVLEKEGYFNNSIVIITSDHGEAFFEHGQYGHGLTHYREEIDIPLFVYIPGIEPGEVDYLVSLIDIMPTIFDYLAFDNPPYMSGQSILPLINGEAVEGERLLFIDRTESDDNVRSVRGERYSLMRRGEDEYTYTMIDNYVEKGPDDIVENPPPELFERLKSSLDNYLIETATEKEKLSSTETEVGIDEERREMIEGLGYL
ncbi:MAG: sulfatase-like hydrolase/transferase [bacterium]|nr:sulfatase-like hydrolase/transferase [bacterium]